MEQPNLKARMKAEELGKVFANITAGLIIFVVILLFFGVLGLLLKVVVSTFVLGWKLI